MNETKPTRPYPLRVPENLMELAEAKSRSERTDRSTALRQLLYAGAEDYVMELLDQGRISSGNDHSYIFRLGKPFNRFPICEIEIFLFPQFASL